MRRGYSAEYEARRKIVEHHGKCVIIKTAGSQNVPDYVVMTRRTVREICGVEVKSTIEKKYRARARDKKQWGKIGKWSEYNDIPVYYYIRTKHESLNLLGRRVIMNCWEILTHSQFGAKYCRILSAPCNSGS